MKKTHFTCPFCGRKAAQVFVERAFPIEFWIQEFGWFKGQPKPTMTWTRFTDGPIVKSLRSILERKLAAVAAMFGYRLVPLNFDVSVIKTADAAISQHHRLISIVTSPEVRMK